MSAKNAAMGLTYRMVWQNTVMALNLKDTFNSEYTINELIDSLKDIEFHKKRAESKSLRNFKRPTLLELLNKWHPVRLQVFGSSFEPRQVSSFS